MGVRLFVKNRISYHNRLRQKEFIEMLESLGGEIQGGPELCRSARHRPGFDP